MSRAFAFLLSALVFLTPSVHFAASLAAEAKADAKTPTAVPLPPPPELVLHLAGPVEKSIKFAAPLEAYKKAGGKKVRIVINSPGGNVGDMYRLIQEVVSAGLPTTCEVTYLAASAAAIFLQSPACGERQVHPYSMVMFHAGRLTLDGTLTQRDLENESQSLASLNRAVAAIVCSRTGWDVEKYHHETAVESKEIYAVGAAAVAMNVADRLLN